MNFSVGIVVFFQAITALAAETVLYLYITGVLALDRFPAAAGSEIPDVIGWATAVYWAAAVFTAIAGLAAPVCGAIETYTGKKDSGMSMFLGVIGLIMPIAFVLGAMNSETQNAEMYSPRRQIENSATSSR